MIHELMQRLSERRPLFCSEADFQHELAHELRLVCPDTQVRLEFPIGAGLRGAVDIQVLKPARSALELKYLCKGLSHMHGEEGFELRHQGAHDIRRYDVCKDVARMEEYSTRTQQPAGVIVLTNDPAYWQPRRRPDTVDAAFDISQGRCLAGALRWAPEAGRGTTKGRERELVIKAAYTLEWRDYSQLNNRAGVFRYLWIPVSPSLDTPSAPIS